MKYYKPEIKIEKIEIQEIASSITDWTDNAGTKDTAITSFYVVSL